MACVRVWRMAEGRIRGGGLAGLQACGIDATQSPQQPNHHLMYRLVPGASVLDVGCGSGYLTACLGACVRLGHHSWDGRVDRRRAVAFVVPACSC